MRTADRASKLKLSELWAYPVEQNEEESWLKDSEKGSRTEAFENLPKRKAPGPETMYKDSGWKYKSHAWKNS